MEIREGYKQTGIGVIPQEWHIQRLHSLVRYHNAGIYKKKELYGEGCNIVGVSNLYEIHYVGGQEFGRVPLSEQELKQYSLTNNDLLYGESSLVREGIARTVYVTKGGAGTAFAWHTRRYSVDQKALLSKYLYYYLQSRPARKHMMAKSIQTALTGINTTEYFACPIPLPPLAEQTAIATALNDADALISSLERLIAKKRNIKQGAMQELLTGKNRLTGFGKQKGYKQTDMGIIPRDWNLDEIQNLANITTGAKNTQDRIPDGEYPFFVRSQTVERINTYSFDGEAVLTAGDGVGTGKVFHYINGKFDFHQRVYKISDFSERLDGYFFYLYFSNNFINRIIQMTAKSSVDSVRREMIAKMFIPLPPKTEQTYIAQILFNMDAEIEALEKKLEKYKMIKQSMMQNLLTGKIRLV